MMSRWEIIILLYMSTNWCFVRSDLGLNEGAPCTTNGINGTCYNIFKCPTAAASYIYKIGGFTKGFPEIPEICSHDGPDPIVCCTDCKIDNEERFRNTVIRPGGMPIEKDGPVSYNKCLDYFQRLPYPCRGKGNFNVGKIWDEEKNCHNFTMEVVYVSPAGGRPAERWEFPHMALLGYGETRDSAQWLCGGSIISERFILTAAHCSSTNELGPIKYAALGLLKRTDPKDLWKIYDIKRIIVHPDYKSPIKYHDIALLETDIEINFGKNLLPACLDVGKKTDWMHHSSGEAAGWGRLGHRQELADNLQVVDIGEFKETECANIYDPHRHLPSGYDHDTQMCYGSHATIIDTCEGDSGGPLQFHDQKCLYFVMGVTSFGKNCGTLGSAGMYTRVSHYAPWIENIVWPTQSA